MMYHYCHFCSHVQLWCKSFSKRRGIDLNRKLSVTIDGAATSLNNTLSTPIFSPMVSPITTTRAALVELTTHIWSPPSSVADKSLLDGDDQDNRHNHNASDPTSTNS